MRLSKNELICDCGDAIPDSEISMFNTENEIGEEYAEVSVQCKKCGAEKENSKWGHFEDLNEAKECLLSEI